MSAEIRETTARNSYTDNLSSLILANCPGLGTLASRALSFLPRVEKSTRVPGHISALAMVSVLRQISVQK